MPLQVPDKVIDDLKPETYANLANQAKEADI
jgi:hypothetical protein